MQCPPGPSPSNKHKLVHTPACPTHTTNNSHFTPCTFTDDSPPTTPLGRLLLTPPCCSGTRSPPLLPAPSLHLSSPHRKFHTLPQQHRFHRFYLDTNVLTTEELQLRKLPKSRTKVFVGFLCSMSNPSLGSRTLSAACGSNLCGGRLHLQSQCCIGFTFFFVCLVCFALVPTRGSRRLATWNSITTDDTPRALRKHHNCQS